MDQPRFYQFTPFRDASNPSKPTEIVVTDTITDPQDVASFAISQAMYNKIIQRRSTYRNDKSTSVRKIVFHYINTKMPNLDFLLDHCQISGIREDVVPTLLDAEQLVVKGKKKIFFHVDWPLKNEARFAAYTDNPDGFTRRDMLLAVSDIYKFIYKEGAETSTIKEGPFIHPSGKSTFNRNITNGKYGIQLQYLEDLWLDSMEYNHVDDCWELNVEAYSHLHDLVKEFEEFTEKTVDSQQRTKVLKRVSG